MSIERLEWTEGGVLLLKKVTETISENGGRLKFADAIMNEALDFFSYQDRKEMDLLLKEDAKRIKEEAILKKKRKPRKPIINILWTKEELITLKSFFGHISIECLSEALQRTPRAILTQFRNISSKQEIIDRRKVKNYLANVRITKNVIPEKQPVIVLKSGEFSKYKAA